MTTAERIQEQLGARNYTSRAFLDFKKAFDTVYHNILLEKLDCYGITGFWERLVFFMVLQVLGKIGFVLT